MNKKQIKEYIKKGVLFLDKKRVFIDKDVKIGSGVVIGGGVTFRGNTEIGKGSELIGDCCLENAKIGENVK